MTSLLRAHSPVYRGVLSARAHLARAPARKFTTPTAGSTPPPPPPPPPKSSNGLYIGLGIGAAALIGGAWYVSSVNEDAGTIAKSAIQTARVAGSFTPTKEDYQKVRCLVRRVATPLFTSFT